MASCDVRRFSQTLLVPVVLSGAQRRRWLFDKYIFPIYITALSSQGNDRCTCNAGAA